MRFALSSACAAFLAGSALFIAPSVTQGSSMVPAPDLTRLKIDENLLNLMRDADEGEVFSALVYLHAQVDLEAMNRDFDARRATMAERNREVLLAMHGVVADTQGPLVADLEARKAAGQVIAYEAFHIVNAARVEGTKQAILDLAARQDVAAVYLNYEIELIEPVPADGGGVITGGPEPGVIAVRAPEVWALGIDGTGVLVANMDTGVAGTHPALASRWAGVADSRYQGHPEWAWFDPVTNTNFPFDQNGHGTHTMGSVCGGAPGDQVGVAPGAYWISAGVIDRVSIPRTVADAILSFQWFANPDGDVNTNWDVPAVCSNSWGVTTGHGYPPCDQTFWQYIDGSEAAGTVQLFSAGNEGTGGLRRPADRATTAYNCLAVASVNANVQGWPISGFSSRGPTNCTPNGQQAIKPDISAPGENVRSSLPGGGYGSLSGTSMASPHVNGVVALIRQANPNLPVDEVKQIIYDTAFDLGPTGEDNAYGWGMIDAYEAVQVAISRSTLGIALPDGVPAEIDPAGGDSFAVVVTEFNAQHQPGSGLLHIDHGSGFQPYPLEETGENTYLATFPPTECGTTVDFYVSVETTDGEVVTNPFGAPSSFFSAFSISDIATLYTETFETDTGWTVSNQDLQAGAWQRAVPNGGGTRGDPSSDSGDAGTFCFVTQNGAGDTDVDGGPTRLLSPNIDISTAPEAILSYQRWFTNDDQDIDRLTVEISNNGGTTWTLVESVPGTGSGSWVQREVRVADYVTPSGQVRLRFSVADNPNDSVTEAAIDDVRIREVVCTTPADLTGFQVILGTHIDGVLADLTASDDSRVRVRSGFTNRFTELHSSQTVVNAVTGVASPITLDVTVESRVNQPAGFLHVMLRNWNTNQFVTVGSFGVNSADQTHTVSNVPAGDYVNGSGQIDVNLKYIVFSPIFAFNFNSLIDLVHIEVE
jgi:subtilisin family serine protease